MSELSPAMQRLYEILAQTMLRDLGENGCEELHAAMKQLDDRISYVEGPTGEVGKEPTP